MQDHSPIGLCGLIDTLFDQLVAACVINRRPGRRCPVFHQYPGHFLTESVQRAVHDIAEVRRPELILFPLPEGQTILDIVGELA